MSVERKKKRERNSVITMVSTEPKFKFKENLFICLGRRNLMHRFPSLLTPGVGGGIGNINKNDLKI